MQHLLLFSISAFISANKGLLITLAIGAVAGLLAQMIVPGRGFGMITTIIIGIIGGWLGGMFFTNFLSFTHNALVDRIICATLGAMILCIVINLIAGSDKRDKYDYNV